MLRGEPAGGGAKGWLSPNVPAAQPEEDGGGGERKREPTGDKNETAVSLTVSLTDEIRPACNCLQRLEL